MYHNQPRSLSGQEVSGQEEGAGEGRPKEEKGEAKAEDVRRARGVLRKAITKARRKCWEELLAEGEDFWAVMRYTKLQRSSAVPAITRQGRAAKSHDEKARMLKEIAFPPPRHMRDARAYLALPTSRSAST